MQKVLIKLGCMLIWIGCICSLAAFLPARHFLIEIFQSLGWYFLLGHSLALVFLSAIFLWERRFRTLLFVTNIPFILFYSYILSTWYFPAATPATCDQAVDTSPQLKTFFANVFKLNENFSALRSQILAEDPHLIGLVEVDQRWIDMLDLDAAYPHHIVRSQDDFFGIALFSKFPLTALPEGFGADLRPTVFAEIEAGEFAGTSVGVVHAMPPRSTYAVTHNRVLYRRMATLLRHVEQPVVLLGDFNATIFSSSLRTFLWGGDLVLAGRGGPYFATWDTQGLGVRLQLDHIIVDRCTQVDRYQPGAEFGSDHLPLIGHFRVG